MACLVSFVSFSFRISASKPNTLFTERNPWKLVLDRPLRQQSYITARERCSSSSVTDSISTLNRISWRYCLTSIRSQCEVVSCPKNVHSCTLVVISGYWVSPDVDDGWGFVDAFVNRVI